MKTHTLTNACIGLAKAGPIYTPGKPFVTFRKPNKAMNNLIATLIIMLFCITALAQQKTTETVYVPRTKTLLNMSKPRAETSTEQAGVSLFTSPVSLQMLLGTQGVGADAKYGISPRLTGRLGFGIIPVNASRGFNLAFPVEGQLSTKFTNLHLLADLAPFKNQAIRIVGGAAYLIKGRASAIITPTGGFAVGSRSLNKDEMGVIYADVNWKGVAPYAGIALFRPFPNRFFNINLDIGTYYLASPGTSFTGTKLFTDNDANARQFNQNMKGYHWMPVIQLDLNFRIK